MLVAGHSGPNAIGDDRTLDLDDLSAGHDDHGATGMDPGQLDRRSSRRR
jgi:hypothetical protein